MEISKILYNKIKDPAIKFCVDHKISANKITLFNHFITLTFVCWFFSIGEYYYGLAALGVSFINGFLDYLDGDVARVNHSTGPLGVWLDSGFDVIIQNAVMGAIAIGCYKNGLSIYWIVLFFISNAASNFVAFNYNQKFEFDSDKGNKMFRYLMERKCHVINKILKDIIDPTGNHLSLAFYTYRYWIVAGVIFNILPWLLIVMTIISTVKWVIMFVIYAIYLSGENRLFILKVLSALDEEKEDYYALRHCEKV